MRLIAIGSETFASELRTCLTGFTGLNDQISALESIADYKIIKIEAQDNVCFIIECVDDAKTNALRFKDILDVCAANPDSVIATQNKSNVDQSLFLYAHGIHQLIYMPLLRTASMSMHFMQILQTRLASSKTLEAIQQYHAQANQFKNVHALHHALADLKNTLSQNPSKLGILAKALEDAGEFQQAAFSYSNALRFHPFDFSAQYGLLRCHLIMGTAERENLLQRNVQMGIEYLSTPDLLTEAARLLALNDKVAQTSLLQIAELHEQRWGVAFLAELRFLLDMDSLDHQDFMQRIRTLSQLQNLVAIRCNGRAISLSQNGKSEEALQIFDATYALVAPPLRYKVSMNAALAALRLNSAERGQRYLKMCRTDYGAELPKFSEIDENLKLLEKQKPKGEAA